MAAGPRASGDRLDPRPQSRGNGYAAEAAEGVLRLGLETLMLHRIDAKLDALNTSSAGLCERLGMRREAERVDNWHYKGKWSTEVIHAILDSKWQDAEIALSAPAPMELVTRQKRATTIR